MTIFDRERQKRADEERKRAGDAARSAKQFQAEDARRRKQDEGRETYWTQAGISQQFLDQSLFPKLLRELESHLARGRYHIYVSTSPTGNAVSHQRRQQFIDTCHEDYGAIGLSLVEKTIHTSSGGGSSFSYRTFTKWIDVIALPNGTIKVEGGLFGKIVLLLDQWRDPSTGLPQQDVAERAIDKAWKHPHRSSESGTGSRQLT